MLTRKMGFYEKYIKRLLDIICSLLALIMFSWLYVIVAIAVRIKLGSPVVFKQPRPGLIDLFKESAFRIRFEAKGRFASYLSRINIAYKIIPELHISIQNPLYFFPITISGLA